MDKIKELGTRIIEDRRTVKILAVIIVVVSAEIGRASCRERV